MDYHPDRNKSHDAEERFKRLTEAYEVLRDPDKRAAYDRYGEAGLRRGASAGAGFDFTHFDLSEALNIFMRDFGNLGGFDAIFGGGERARDRHRGADLKVTLKLTLADVAAGTTKTVRVRTLDRCAACGGTGAKEGTRPTTCGSCGGAGDLVFDLPISFGQAALGGDVEIPTPYGPALLKVQPGTQTGTVYRMRGKGLPRLGEGGRGDLHVRVRVWTPTNLTPEQQELLQRLAAIEAKPPMEEGAAKKFWEQIRQAFGG